MERVWQWMWDRHGRRYSWGVYALASGTAIPAFWVAALGIVAVEDSDRFLAAAAFSTAVALVALYVIVLPGGKAWRAVERWASGRETDEYLVLESTYTYARKTVVRGLTAAPLAGGVLGLGTGSIAGASGSRLTQYAVIGFTLFIALELVAVHQYVEMRLRPCRAAITTKSEIGDEFPRLRPSFATWANVAIMGTAYIYALGGAILAITSEWTSEYPIVTVLIGAGMTLFFAVPLTLGTAFVPAFRPIRDLAAATARVTDGDYSQRVPVVQDDDLGALTASFNRMQAGLAERERLHAAFGSYVDPALAERLLAQGDDLFQGEEVHVTVFFADIRNFTTYAEHATASEAVARLNSLWDIIVPILRHHHGHANKFLGDGVLAVFGVPEALTDHADHAVAAAREIQERVRETFGTEMRIGIGINTGIVIAGTIGGGGKLEFTLIGDPVNVAARVEQLTKETGDSILLTQATVDALHTRPTDLGERGAQVVRGRDATVNIYAIDAAHG